MRQTQSGHAPAPPEQGGWAERLCARILDLIFPPRCVGCGRMGTLFCTACLDTLRYLPPGICARCGRPIRRSGQPTCTTCQRAGASTQAAFAVAYSASALRRAIHRLKYAGQTGLADPLAGLLIEWWGRQGFPIDLVVPVPLHPRRERERGFNQAGLLARRFSAAINLPYQPQLLLRTRYTRPQVGLSAGERRQNVDGAFHCPAGDLGGAGILLIDDLTTTGATLEASACALRAAGAGAVWALTVAHAAPTRLPAG